MTGLPYEQVTGLVNLVEGYREGWQPACGRHHEMELFDGVLATLFYYRHNCSQHVVGAVFGVSQPTISRVITILEEPIAAVLDREVPELVEVIIGRVVIPEGTLIPTRNRARHPELYSGKRHRSGAAVQVLSSTEGRLCHVGEPLVAATHDITTFRETALAAVLEEHMHDNLVIADLGYLGEPVCTPAKSHPKESSHPPKSRRTNTSPESAQPSNAPSPTSRTGKYLPPDTVDPCGNSPLASSPSPHSNSIDSTGPVVNNALGMQCHPPTVGSFIR